MIFAKELVITWFAWNTNPGIETQPRQEELCLTVVLTAGEYQQERRIAVIKEIIKKWIKDTDNDNDNDNENDNDDDHDDDNDNDNDDDNDNDNDMQKLKTPKNIY